MKKKILIISIILMIMLCGCRAEEQTTNVSEENYMVTISHEYLGDIVYDKRTGVEYWRSYGAYNSGSLTLLVDKDGKPLIYNGGE